MSRFTLLGSGARLSTSTVSAKPAHDSSPPTSVLHCLDETGQESSVLHCTITKACFLGVDPVLRCQPDQGIPTPSYEIQVWNVSSYCRLPPFHKGKGDGDKQDGPLWDGQAPRYPGRLNARAGPGLPRASAQPEVTVMPTKRGMCPL